MSEEKESKAVESNLSSQPAVQQVPNDGFVQQGVFPTDNPPLVEKQKKENISIGGRASFHLFTGNEAPERECH